jgi:short-subunit dehydrogenase
MKVKGAVALVTGANQGIGQGFVEGLLEFGVAKVYATARRPDSLDQVVALDRKRVVPLRLDILNPEHRKLVGAQASDLTLLINNAGIPGSDIPAERRFLSAKSLDDVRAVMETDFFAQAEMCRVFAPVLRRGKDTAIINMLSIGALYCVPEFASYSAAKAAAAIMTQGVRAELAGDGVLVCGVFTAGVATRMSGSASNVGGYNDRPRIMTPVEHARDVLHAAEEGVEDIYAGTGVQGIVDAWRRDPKALEKARAERFRQSQAAGK